MLELESKLANAWSLEQTVIKKVVTVQVIGFYIYFKTIIIDHIFFLNDQYYWATGMKSANGKGV